MEFGEAILPWAPAPIMPLGDIHIALEDSAHV